MLPKVVFETNYDLHKHFIYQDRYFPIKKYRKLLNNINKFKGFFQKYERRVLKLIKKYIGGKWKEKEIRVFFFVIPHTHRYPSLYNPLLIKMRDDFYQVTYILIHELIHRYLYFNNVLHFFKDSQELESVVHLIADLVQKKLFGTEKSSQIKNELQKTIFTINLNEISILKEKLDKKYKLESHTLLYYLKK